jgi:small subunit ribosomal protein S20
MPGVKANKAARAAERKRLRNRLVRGTVKTYILKAKASIASQEESAQERTKLAISQIDKAVSKGVFHRNKAARLKSRLMKRLNSLLARGAGQSQEKRGP